MQNHKETTESSSNGNARILSSMNDIERKLRELEIKSNVGLLAEKLEHVSYRLDKLEENNSARSRQSFQKPPEVTNKAQVTPSGRSDSSRVNYREDFSDIPPSFNDYNSQTRPRGNFPLSSVQRLRATLLKFSLISDKSGIDSIRLKSHKVIS